jgi:hypothetical protein
MVASSRLQPKQSRDFLVDILLQPLENLILKKTRNHLFFLPFSFIQLAYSGQKPCTIGYKELSTFFTHTGGKLRNG